MARIAASGLSEFKALESAFAAKATGAKSLEAAAQAFTKIEYEAFRESVALCRVFATIPFGALPASNKQVVTSLATAKGVANKLTDSTLVLSLVGTSGAKPGWNDRKQSQGHVGIPLVSGEFVNAIPMMARLLKQLGLGVDWIDSNDTEMVKRTMGRLAGLFYAEDASTETDKRGRKVIAGQEFVKSEGIKTVFGFGGGYLGTNVFFVNVLFCKETVDKAKADQFSSSMSFFKAKTATLLGTPFG